MPNTYVALETVTVGSAVSSVSFNVSGLSYTDLVLVADNVGSSASVVDLRMRFNSDSSSLYSETDIYGTGSSALSSRSSRTFAKLSYSGGSDKPMLLANIMNYANTTTFKTVLVRDNATTNVTRAAVCLYRNTAAITSFEISYSSGNIAAGATFSLYGIANADLGAAKATGGMITEDSQYWYHTFTSSGAFVPKQSLTCDILQVAGGASGGTRTGGYNAGSGGGGAGGLLSFTSQALTAISYNVTVGAGGPARGLSTYLQGANGNNSQFGSLTASVGGGGGARGINTNNDGANGGSGGGANYSGGAVGQGTVGQGNNGGLGGVGAAAMGGGGGGAGGVGGNANSGTNTGGLGGVGATSSLINAMGAATSSGQLSGGNYYFAGGGGGGSYSGPGGTGGLGGGGAAGSNPGLTAAVNGTANTGGGGGADGEFSAGSGAGGSGIVIVRYAK